MQAGPERTYSMSGVCGIYSWSDPDLASATLLNRMLEALGHRGRAANSSYVDARAGIALGHVCASGFRPPGTAPTPQLHEDGSRVATLDGAIFNAAALLAPVHPRAGDGDAAAVAAHLRDRLADFPARLDGHFALAVWDKATRHLWLARDGLGGKPLYWCHVADKGLVVFASEPKGVLAHPAVARRVDRAALTAYLTFGYVPAPLSLFDGIHKVFPGEVLRFDRDGRSTRRQYWQLPPFAPRAGDDVAAIAAELRVRVIGLVAKHLGGARNVGLYFSGGLESSILAGVVRMLGVPQLHTFTLGFRTAGARPTLCEDVRWAEHLAPRFGANQHSLLIGGDHDPGLLLPRILHQFDEPIVTPNCYSKYLLAQAARAAGIDSCLSGSNAEASLERSWTKTIRKMNAALGAGASDEERLLYACTRVFPLDEQAALLAEPVEHPREVAMQVVARYRQGIVADDLGDLLDGTLLRMQGAEKAIAVLDRTAVLSDLEVRHPYFDRDLVEFASTVPARLKGGEADGMRRAILRAAFADIVPPDIAARTKVGYPSYYWNHGELDQLQGRLLSQAHLARSGLLRPEAVQAVLAADRNDTAKSAGRRTWALMLLQAWFDLYVDCGPLECAA
jgi:asparagine synthase (glutamine-hydrolysing)